MFLTYKYRLLPTKRQHEALVAILESQRQLYNAALEERIDSYRKTGRSRSYIDQCKDLTKCRCDIHDMSVLPVNIQRWTLRRLDDAYAAFFRRLKSGGKAGFPRFRGENGWSAFGFAEIPGIKFDGKRLRFKGMNGGIRVHMHRSLPHDADIKGCIFKKDVKGWSICFQISIPSEVAKIVETSIGVDVGIETLAYLSDGVAIPNPRIAKHAEKEMRRRQRALSRCKQGSKRRQKVRIQVAKLHRKIATARRTYLHQASAMLIKNYDLIAFEALNMKGLANGMLAKQVNDAGWPTLIEMTRYKAEKAGGTVVLVDPRLTSQTCSGCGTIVRKELSVRVHECSECGLVLNRDHNAAKNILQRAVLGPWFHKLGSALTGTGNLGNELVSVASKS